MWFFRKFSAILKSTTKAYTESEMVIFRRQVYGIGYYTDYDIQYFFTNNFFDLASNIITSNPYNGEYKYLLEFRLNRLDSNYISSTNFKPPNGAFILDFDLDYFPTRESLMPKNRNFIEDLINKAQFITIAREKTYFEKNREQEGFSIEECEDLLMNLIDTTLLLK